MTDLSNWDFADQFHGYEAAALMLGIAPEEYGAYQQYVEPALARLQRDYGSALAQAQDDVSGCIDPFDDSFDAVISEPPPNLLISVTLERLWRDASNGQDAPLSDWVFNIYQSHFEQQKFTRIAIAAWLKSTRMKSVYRFDSMQDSEPPATDQSEIDPADFPVELQAANIAFRAVSNGFGDPAATFRNRLIEYLKATYPALTSEAVNRIATVANPDKDPGRKKSPA